MKRRNAAEGKRRPVKRTKITDNLFGSTLVYVKLLLLWVLVLAADYLLEFRFEYLWPFWLLVRSIYDSFKYQGLAFSVFFICIALTSDMICFLFIPVHWLFFAASTYVWVQYVWHTEKGICLPTVFLWLLFVYIEAAIRLKEYKLHIDIKNLPFNLDLCRPFAAHCIGYPVVTLGFGFKSYVGYRMRQRRQKEIQSENETYYSLLREALPPGQTREEAFNPHPSPKPGALGAPVGLGLGPGGTSLSENSQERISNGVSVGSQLQLEAGDHEEGERQGQPHTRSPDKTSHSSHFLTDLSVSPQGSKSASSHSKHSSGHNGVAGAGTGVGSSLSSGDSDDLKQIEKSGKEKKENHSGMNGSCSTHNGSADREMEDVGPDVSDVKSLNRSNSKSMSGGGNGGRDTSRKGRKEGDEGKGGGKDKDKDKDKNNDGRDHLPLMIKLESDVKRLKCDLQLSRNRENELRDQIVCYMSSERSLKSEISSLLVEKSGLEARINNLISARASDKQATNSLERKLEQERKQRADFQNKLETERKSKKEALGEKNLAVAQQSANSATLTKLEAEIAKLKDELARTEQRANSAEEEIMNLRKTAGLHGDPEKLVAALSVAQDNQQQLEHSLSSETKIKMDLFSALGEAKRQLQIRETMLMAKDREILDLKGNIAEMLAVMPGTAGGVGLGLPFGAGVAGGPGPQVHRAPGHQRASSGIFTPYSMSNTEVLAAVAGCNNGQEIGVLDLPAGTELARLAGLGGLDSMDPSVVVTSSTMYTNTNGSLNEA